MFIEPRIPKVEFSQCICKHDPTLTRYIKLLLQAICVKYHYQSPVAGSHVFTSDNERLLIIAAPPKYITCAEVFSDQLNCASLLGWPEVSNKRGLTGSDDYCVVFRAICRRRKRKQRWLRASDLMLASYTLPHQSCSSNCFENHHIVSDVGTSGSAEC